VDDPQVARSLRKGSKNLYMDNKLSSSAEGRVNGQFEAVIDYNRKIHTVEVAAFRRIWHCFGGLVSKWYNRFICKFKL